MPKSKNNKYNLREIWFWRVWEGLGGVLGPFWRQEANKGAQSWFVWPPPPRGAYFEVFVVLVGTTFSMCFRRGSGTHWFSIVAPKMVTQWDPWGWFLMFYLEEVRHWKSLFGLHRHARIAYAAFVERLRFMCFCQFLLRLFRRGFRYRFSIYLFVDLGSRWHPLGSNCSVICRIGFCTDLLMGKKVMQVTQEKWELGGWSL